jgi:hypothetical protein
MKKLSMPLITLVVCLLTSAVRPDERVCPMDVEGAPEGGGIAGNGWDGPGTNPVTIFWHVEGDTPDMGVMQRQALIEAMQAWAGVVEITFVELPVANANVSVDWNFLTGNHCAQETAECGDSSCPFDGPGGIFAHAGFPPGVNSICVNPMPETFAGNVHFDDDETWEHDDEGPAGALSLALIACHEVGHSIGLSHDFSGGGDVMRPTFSSTDTFVGLSADDIVNVQSGYESGTGAVITLNETGVWVDHAYVGTELGTQAQPFTSLAEGVNGVPPASTGVIIHLQSGAYPELFINRDMVLVAEGGLVSIGN